MKKAHYRRTDLICLNCGYVATINRKFQKLKEYGHIKDMYCPVCKADSKFYEILNVDIFKWHLENKTYLNEMKAKILTFLKEREEFYDKSRFRLHKKILTKE